VIEPAAVPVLAVLSFALLAIGAAGVLWRRNLLVSLMALQIMLAAGQLAFVAFATSAHRAGLSTSPPTSPPLSPAAAVSSGSRAEGLPPGAPGRSFALVAVAVGAAQGVLGLGIAGALFRNRDSVDVETAASMRW